MEIIHHRDHCQTVAYTLTIASGGWVLWLRLWRSDPRERTGVGCYGDTLRELVGPPERQEIIAKGALLMASSQNVGLCECHKWDELAVVCNFRSIKAGVNAKVELYVTAVCNTRGVNMGCLIAARVGVGARG